MWAASNDSVRALMLLGSRARLDQPADEWSDTDLLIISTDPQRWLDDGAWLEQIGPVILTFVEATELAGLHERRVLFDGAVDMDLVLVPVDRTDEVLGAEGALPVLARGYRLLVDKDDALDGLSERVAAADPSAIHAAAPWPADPSVVANAMNDYLYHCVWATKKLRRGELAVAVDCQNGHQATTLRRFVEWQAKARSDGRANTFYDGRFLERWAAPTTIKGLEVAYAHYDAGDMGRAILGGLDLFREVATEVATSVGVAYPDAGHAWVRSWITRTSGT
jgi:aminoglycoside 6-adenylyltransferase